MVALPTRLMAASARWVSLLLGSDDVCVIFLAPSSIRLKSRETPAGMFCTVSTGLVIMPTADSIGLAVALASASRKTWDLLMSFNCWMAGSSAMRMRSGWE